MNYKKGFDFTAFKIKQSNVLLAWEKVKANLGLDKQEKIEGREVKLPKIDAYCIKDEAYVDMHLYRTKADAKRSKKAQLAEYGCEISEEATSAFTRFFWDAKTGNFDRAEIYIRSSIYEKSKTDSIKRLSMKLDTF